MQFAQAVSANVTAFDTQFWLRLAARVDTTADTEEQERLRSLANTVMVLVDKMMKATEQQLENSGQVVQEILRAGSNANDEWDVPMKDAQVASMRQVLYKGHTPPHPGGACGCAAPRTNLHSVTYTCLRSGACAAHAWFTCSQALLFKTDTGGPKHVLPRLEIAAF